jgi:hypothetical protein
MRWGIENCFQITLTDDGSSDILTVYGLRYKKI